MLNSGAILDRAARWFLDSGIQSPHGGVARYYYSDREQNAGVSTEITGYAISFLVYAYERTAESEYLEAAVRSARFLVREAWNPALKLFPFEYPVTPDVCPLAYFFDSGIVIRGLLAAWKVTGEGEFLDVSTAAGHGMLQHFPGPDGPHPILHLPDCQPMEYHAQWSAAPGCYQLKAAMAWQDLFEVTGLPEFHAAYEAEVERAMATHGTFLPGASMQEKVMDRLHAYAYFLEAMLPRAGRPECQEAYRTGMDRIGHYLDEISPVFVRSDVYGQLLRARVFAAELGIAPLDEAAAEREARAAAEFQFKSDDPRLDGGFGFGLQRGQTMSFVNPVSTAFCAQALDMWQLHRRGAPAPRHEVLV